MWTEIKNKTFVSSPKEISFKKSENISNFDYSTGVFSAEVSFIKPPISTPISRIPTSRPFERSYRK
jgi:hypothetical protein